MNTIPAEERTRFQSPARRLFAGCFIVCVVGLGVSLASALTTEDGFKRFSFSYLTNLSFFLSIALGALFFVLIQHLTKSGWSVTVRRVAEIIAATLPVLAAATAPLLVLVATGTAELYPWASHDHDVADPHLAHALHVKAGYLNVPFFLGRCALYLGVWSILGMSYWVASRRQDSNGESRWTLLMEKFSAPGLVLFAITVTFGAFDLIMSLQPVWYSSIFGVYFFSGAVIGGLSFLILALKTFQQLGYVRRSVSVEHYHDLGKFLFAFVVFWGYIAFSQYLLIWYANIPETTFWYAKRGATTAEGGQNGWTAVTLLLLFGHLVVPFFGLMSRHVKRSRYGLAAFAVWMLALHWVDLWWLVLPEFSGEVAFGLPEIGGFLGLGGLFAGTFFRLAAENQLLPVQDPRLHESLAFENL